MADNKVGLGITRSRERYRGVPWSTHNLWDICVVGSYQGLRFPETFELNKLWRSIIDDESKYILVVTTFENCLVVAIPKGISKKIRDMFVRILSENTKFSEVA